MRTGSAWRYMPHDLPPWEATYQQRRRWLFSAGVFEEIVHDLRVHSWGFRRAGRPIRRPRYSTLALYAPPLRAALGAAMMDTSTRRAPRYTQRWILWGTCSGLVLVTPANEQERAAWVGELAKAVQEEATGESVELAYVDEGYTGGERAAEEAEAHGMRLEVINHEEAKRGFVLLPRRWVVEMSQPQCRCTCSFPDHPGSRATPLFIYCPA